jgi:hypothetical protein
MGSCCSTRLMRRSGISHINAAVTIKRPAPFHSIRSCEVSSSEWCGRGCRAPIQKTNRRVPRSDGGVAKSNAGELVRIEDVVYARDAFENNSASRLSLNRSLHTVVLESQSRSGAIRNSYGGDHKCQLAIVSPSKNNVLERHPSVADRKES